MVSKTFSRAPFRLGLAGGGTDVVPYCYELEGAVINVSIAKFCYVSLENSSRTIFCSRDLGVEEVYDREVRGVLVLHYGVHRYFEGLIAKEINLRVETLSEAPAGSGLGSSSTIVVGLVKAYARHLNLEFTKFQIAEICVQIERIELGLSGGLQDQYSAVFGGFNFISFTRDGDTIVNSINVSDSFSSLIESSVFLVNSGRSRDSSLIIESQKKLAASNDSNFLLRLSELRRYAFVMHSSLLREDWERFISVMLKSWSAKKDSSSGITNPYLIKLEKDVLNAGGLAFKVSGAGGGGYCQVYTSPASRADVQQRLMSLGYGVEPVYFHNKGAQSWTIS